MIGPFTILTVAFAAQAQPAPDCSYDRQAMMALSQNAFDQDLQGGWRPLADRAGCRLVAADLIRDYRRAHQSEDRILYWHEGQLRALEELTEAAISLFERARRSDTDVIGWNHYVDATVAFLRRDRDGVLAARARLVALPRPENFARVDSAGRPLAWPLNLRIIERFASCFGRTYAEALEDSPCAD
jgi:hypothetical protein